LISVLVSHPHAGAIANATAAALERQGKLALYVTGVAGGPSSPSGTALGWAAAKNAVWKNRILEGVDPVRLRSLAAVEVGTRLLGGMAGRVSRRFPSVYDLVYLVHDRAVATIPWPRAADTVYTYEDCALRTFQRARRRRMRTVLDVASPYYRALEGRWRDECRRWPDAMDTPPHLEPDWKGRRKDGELKDADLVSVASSHTRSSLEGAPVRRAPAVVPYGFPVDLFPPKEGAPSGPFTVLAVGSQTMRKGTHCLLMAWKRAGLRDARLKLIGPLALGRAFLDQHAGIFEHVEHLPRTALGAEYRNSDLVAFPTLGDGFGLVIQEGMCSGTPVVTTPSGGGPECITHGVDGWIVPAGDIDALVETLRYCAANRDQVRRVGQAARARAERWTWREAGQALIKVLEEHQGLS